MGMLRRMPRFVSFAVTKIEGIPLRLLSSMVAWEDAEAPMPNPARELPKAESRKAEQRMTLRRPARRAATVTFAAEKPPVTCVIWDISEGGARLAVAHPLATLPHHFTVNLSKDESVRRDCEVVWTDTRFVGVKFTNLAP
jgi:hypothetical protein